MTIIDANVLLYAYNTSSPQYASVSKWLSGLLRSGESVGMPSVSLWAFVRISTTAKLWANPRSVKDTFAIVHDLLKIPTVVVLQPGLGIQRFLNRWLSAIL